MPKYECESNQIIHIYYKPDAKTDTISA